MDSIQIDKNDLIRLEQIKKSGKIWGFGEKSVMPLFSNRKCNRQRKKRVRTLRRSVQLKIEL